MTPPSVEVKDTHTTPRQMHVPWASWRDFKHAAKAAPADRARSARQVDRAANIRAFIAWFLHRPGATLPERPLVKDWSDAARADTAMPDNPNLPRQVRIGNDWGDFELAAKAVGKERAELVREYIAWFLRRRGAKIPDRPDPEKWIGDAPVRDDLHDLEYAAKAIGMTSEEVTAAFIAWFLHRPANLLPKRPAVEEWLTEARGAAAQPAAKSTRKRT